MQEERLLMKFKAFQKGLLIGITIVLLGFTLYQKNKIKELKKQLYHEQRYCYQLEREKIN